MVRLQFTALLILQASTLQMAILLMFNTSDQYTLQQLMETLDIKDELLVQVSNCRQNPTDL